MSQVFDSLAMNAAAGVRRRTLLRSLFAATATAGTGLLAGRNVLAQEQQRSSGPTPPQPTRNGVKMRAFTLKMKMPSGQVSLLHLPDRFAGRVTLPDGTALTLMPLIVEHTKQVELGVYSQGRNMHLERRLTLGAHAGQIEDAPFTDAKLPSAPGFEFAALWLRDIYVPATYNAEDDCCVNCA